MKSSAPAPQRFEFAAKLSAELGALLLVVVVGLARASRPAQTEAARRSRPSGFHLPPSVKISDADQSRLTGLEARNQSFSIEPGHRDLISAAPGPLESALQGCSR